MHALLSLLSPLCTRPAPRWTARSDPRQLDLLDWQPRIVKRKLPPPEPWAALTTEQIYTSMPWLTPFALMTDRIRMVEDDPIRQLWASVLRTSWVNATWIDSREGQPFVGRVDADKERLSRISARRDAIAFWAGELDPADDCEDPGWGDDDMLLTLPLIGGEILGWPVDRLRAEAHRRLRLRSRKHSDMLSAAVTASM